MLLQGVRVTGVIEYEETVTVKMNSKHVTENNVKLDSWKEKRLHGQFLRETPETTHVIETWSWLRKADLKIKTEAPMFAAQKQALRTKYITDYHIDKTAESPL